MPPSSILSETSSVLGTLVRSGLLAPMRPDKYLRIANAIRREGMTATFAFASAAQRCPERLAIVDEIGTLTWRELDQQCNALGAALQNLPSGTPATIGIMCRNHRGFVEALVAANRVGADMVLLNTSFAGPALAEVADREGLDAVIYDQEFESTIETALADRPRATRIVAWADGGASCTVESMIAQHRGHRPERPSRKGAMILLTSGTTGTPKGAKHAGGSPKTLTT